MLFQHGLSLQLYRYDHVIQQRLMLNMRFLGLAEGQDPKRQLREALRLNLHLGDEVIRGRIIQLVEQILVDGSSVPLLTEIEVRSEFESSKEQYQEPRKYSIQHIYFPVERANEAEELHSRIGNEGLSFASVKNFSALFLQGYQFRAQSPQQLENYFGTEFVENFEAFEPTIGAWVGPVESTFGLHLVWVDAIEDGRSKTLEEVRPALERELDLQRRHNALQQAVIKLRDRYEVLL